MRKNVRPVISWSLFAAITIASLYAAWVTCTLGACDFVNDPKGTIAPLLSLVFRKALFFLLLFIGFAFLSKVIFGFSLPKLVKVTRAEGYEGWFQIAKIAYWFAFPFVLLFLITGSLSGLLTSAGLIGFGLTLALQKPILNFVGWLTIVSKGMYRVGDRIIVGNIRGDVKEIQLMNTVLEGLLDQSQNRSHKTVTFPNDMVLTQELTNFTKDSNYVLEELSVTITYESNYKKAIALLEQIVITQIRRNKSSYLKSIQRRRTEINRFINSLVDKRIRSRKEEKQLAEQAEQLKKDHANLNQQEKELDELDEEFRPKIHVELKDSAIQLTAQFLTPYTVIRKNRTDINLAFLDAVAKTKDIEIAYPHLQIVYPEKRSQG